MWIIGPIIQILLAGVVFGALLQIASKIVLKDSIEFGDAFRTAIVACAVIVFGDYALVSMFDGLGYTAARLVSFFLIWTLALMIVVGLDLVQSLLIALVFMVIGWVLMLVLGLVTAGVAAA